MTAPRTALLSRLGCGNLRTCAWNDGELIVSGSSSYLSSILGELKVTLGRIVVHPKKGSRFPVCYIGFGSCLEFTVSQISTAMADIITILLRTYFKV